MKRLIVIFVLIYLNVPARYCMLTNNIIEVNTLDVPSPYEFLWITTMSYCNVHYLIYNMFIGVGLPIQNQTYSNDDIAAFLLPDNIYDWPDETALESPYKLINFREASEIIESFVFEIKEFKNVTGTENKITGLNIWALIDDKMVNFMNKINILSNQVNQYINDLNIQKNNVSTVDPSTMKNLYLNIFDQMVDVMTENIIPYKNAFNFLEKYTSKNNQKINIKQEQKFKNNFNLREYTRTELAKEYELYIDALSIFYNTQWNDKKVSKSNFIMWYDLNSSKSIFDYTASKLLTYVIKLEEYIKETYKYNTKNIPKLTSKVQEYVSTNLYHIIGLIKSPLQKILKYKDLNKNEILLSLESNDETMVNGLSSANDKDSNIKRIKNVQLNWNDSNIQTLVWDIINKYNTSLCDNNVNHNTKLMNWVEQMSSDEQKTNVVKSSIYATIIVKNFENVVLCSNEENDSEKDKEKLIKNLIHVVDEKLNEIQTYSKYSAIDNGENVISDIWNYIKNENNNIFNILDWLNKNISRSNIPYWPNDMPCNEIYIKNLIQLASVSSDMIYDVTLTSMHKALDNNEIDNDEEESNALYILEDLERTKHTYKNVLQQIKNIIKINTMYIESNSLIDRNLKHKAMQELAKCIKYKIFAMTEIIIPTYRITEYYTQVIPEDTHDYSEVINNMHNIFYKYFGNKTNIEQRNGTALDLIKKNEHEILTIYNKLRYKHKKIKEKHRYLMVLKYNVINAKKMYRTIISQLKKITTVNNDLNLKNNEKEVKRKLITTVALIMEDFIRYDTYINWENQKTPLYDGKYKYSISGIDFESELITIDYMHIYNQKHLQRQSTKSRNEDTLPNYPNNENKKNFGVLHDSSIMSSQKTVDQGTGDNKNTLYMYSTMTHVDENKTPDHRGSDVGRTPYIINENSLDINKRLLGGKNATTSDTSTSSVDTSSGEHHTVKKIASSSYKSMVETSTIKSAEGGSDENKTPDHRGSDVGRTPYIINQYSLDINKRLLGGKNTTTADTSTTSVDTLSGEHHTVKRIASSSYKSMVATSTITSADGGSDENGYNDKDFESNVNTSKPVIDLKDVSNMLTDYVDNTITPDNNTRNNFSSISNKSHNTNVTSTAQITDV